MPLRLARPAGRSRSAFAGCGGTRACRSGTLFVTVDFVADAISAEKVSIDVKPEGAPLRTEIFDHAPGATEGTIEVDFPAGYQSGSRVTLVLTARKNGAAVRRDHQLGGAVVGLQLGHRPARRHALRRRQRRRERRRRDWRGRRRARARRERQRGCGAGAGGTGAGGKTDGGARRQRRGRPDRRRRRHRPAASSSRPRTASTASTTIATVTPTATIRRATPRRPACPAAGSNGFVPGAWIDPVAQLSGAFRRRRVDDQLHARPRRGLHRLLV